MFIFLLQTTECGGGKYLCLEPLSLRDYFLSAGYPAGGSKETVKLEHSFYTEDDVSKLEVPPIIGFSPNDYRLKDRFV